MPRLARSTSIDPNIPQIVHIWNRCVRRSYLCGRDAYTGKSFEHRRPWARKRLEHLASCFGVDVITYAIMENHTHQILQSRPDIVATWDDRTVARRWLSIDPKKINGKPKEPSETAINQIVNSTRRLKEIRRRLSDVSWWMRCFSQHIACRANREDDARGHFWEARFYHQVIDDEASLLACMIYVDLNPIRASMAATPEESDFTGIKERIDDLRLHLQQTNTDQLELYACGGSLSFHDWERIGSKQNQFSGWLRPIEVDEFNDPLGPDPESGNRRSSRKGVLGLSLMKYIELLEWCGREVRSDKRGAIADTLSPVLSRLGLDAKQLMGAVLKSGSGLSEYLQIQTAPMVNRRRATLEFDST